LVSFYNNIFKFYGNDSPYEGITCENCFQQDYACEIYSCSKINNPNQNISLAIKDRLILEDRVYVESADKVNRAKLGETTEKSTQKSILHAKWLSIQ